MLKSYLDLLEAAKNPKVVLIDADLLVYRVLSVAQRTDEWPGAEGEPPSRTTTIDVPTAVSYFREKIAVACPSGETPWLALSDKENWRKDEFPEYKSNRRAEKPLGFDWLRKRLISRYPTVMLPRLEGDDILGIAATAPGAALWIATDDKDLGGVPCRLRELSSGIESVVIDQEADRWHARQTITGDPVDGYKGCRGAGPKAAEEGLTPEAVAAAGGLWPAVLAVYRKFKQTPEDALRQARMARILRFGDYDPQTAAVTMFTPPEASPAPPL